MTHFSRAIELQTFQKFFDIAAEKGSHKTKICAFHKEDP